MRSTKTASGSNSYGTAGVVTLLTGPFGALVKDKDVEVAAGTEFTIYIPWQCSTAARFSRRSRVCNKSVFVFSCLCGRQFQKEGKAAFHCPDCGRLLVVEWRAEYAEIAVSSRGLRASAAADPGLHPSLQHSTGAKLDSVAAGV